MSAHFIAGFGLLASMLTALYADQDNQGVSVLVKSRQQIVRLLNVSERQINR